MRPINMIYLCAALTLQIAPSSAREDGRWAEQSDQVREWYAKLMQPDNPLVSCCGEADAVEADNWVGHEDGSMTAFVTNGRGFLPEGMEIKIPKRKIKHDAGNPTGHSILFYSHLQGVYCFVMASQS